MNAIAFGSPLLKLLRATRGDADALKGPSHLALRLAIARAGRQSLDADILVTDIAVEQVDGAQSLIDPLAEFALVGKLSSMTEDAGLVAADRHAVAAVTALRTTKTLPTAVPERGASIVESALIQPLLTDIITAWATTLEDDKDADAQLIQGYRATGRARSVRSLAMSIPQGAMTLFRIELEFAGSAPGKLVFAFPNQRMAQAKLSDAGRTPPDPKAWTRQFGEELREAPTRVDAILMHHALSVTELRNLKPGDVLPVPNAALTEIALHGTKGALIGTGRLGQLSGFRAVRLNARQTARDGGAPDPSGFAGPEVAAAGLASAAAMGADGLGGNGAKPLESPAPFPEEEPAMILDSNTELAFDEPPAMDLSDLGEEPAMIGMEPMIGEEAVIADEPSPIALDL